MSTRITVSIPSIKDVTEKIMSSPVTTRVTKTIRSTTKFVLGVSIIGLSRVAKAVARAYIKVS